MATSVPVLVTRPAGQADSLAKKIEQAGFTAHHQPLLELTALPELPGVERQKVLDLDLYQHVIFISANAVRFGMAFIDEYWPQLPIGVHWYAIGSSTAALLAERGLQPVTPALQMNSEGLLAAAELAQVQDQRVLIVKGEGGRETLRRELTARGARVDELACYRRGCPALEAGMLARRLVDIQPKVILISSGEGLQNLLALLSAEETTKFMGIDLIVPSLRVAEMALQAGFEHVATAENASDEAMLAALEQWRSGD